MEDTPEHVKKIQLQIWLSKTPAERLLQAILDNEAQFAFWKHAKAALICEAKSNETINTDVKNSS